VRPRLAAPGGLPDEPTRPDFIGVNREP
jgi:hypothetical protein